MNKVNLMFAILALGVASAAPKTLHMTLGQTAWVGETQLQPGDYKVSIQADKAILILGKKQIELPAKMESNSRTFDSNRVVITDASTRPTLQEIDFGGTNTRIVFSTSAKTD
jgi:hypothetical protein